MDKEPLKEQLTSWRNEFMDKKQLLISLNSISLSIIQALPSITKSIEKIIGAITDNKIEK